MSDPPTQTQLKHLLWLTDQLPIDKIAWLLDPIKGGRRDEVKIDYWLRSSTLIEGLIRDFQREIQ